MGRDARIACIDGNEAAARVAHALSEVVAIYPITPASSMGELADTWSAEGRTNIWGAVPEVVEMQSEAGAAGLLHGAAMKGALATTFTSSQGLLLMIPNMFKLAGELTPAVIHVAARTIATHALSIFGDHSDVMAVRSTGFAMLSASSVQEAHDFALVAHAASLESRMPFLHFFDGFRTSHELCGVDVLDEEDIRRTVDAAAVAGHRARGLSPDHPVIRGTSQNPDVFFQSREASTPVHAAVPSVVEGVFARLAERTGRHYGLADYVGAPDADRVLVLMGSAAGAAAETVEELCRRGERVGAVVVRLYRPFPVDALLEALPTTARIAAVLDRTKEPGAVGDPLHLDVAAALAESDRSTRTVGVRYGLASKELTPSMLKGLFDELASTEPRRRMTLGIVDDVSGTSVEPDPSFQVEGGDFRAVFYGLGSDGTVGAAKQTVKILSEACGLHAQGYFVYDSKKAGTLTVSHLRSGPAPIGSTYLVQQADFVGCHQFSFLDRVDVLALARPGATLLLNSPHPAGEVWDRLPREVQQDVVDKDIELWVVDAERLATEAGLGRRINTIMQAAFFGLAGMLSHDKALAELEAAVERAYAKRGRDVVKRNVLAIEGALHAAQRVEVPAEATSERRRRVAVPDDAPEFVRRVIGPLLSGEGDLLPVSAMPADGTFPVDTAKWEKRALASSLPVWDPSICTDCGKCAIVCPHAAIRMKVVPAGALAGAPTGLLSKDFRSRDLPGQSLVIQVAPDDCTGCGVCVEVCPGLDKADRARRSLVMVDADGRREAERESWSFFLDLPELDVDALPPDSVKGSQARQPLFEFSGACAGCGETSYVKLLTQLFGDRSIVANATGCSSIYGGNLPTTPWSCNAEGRGPAWANSLFEDNAEFGMGLRVAADTQHEGARALLGRLAPVVGDALAAAILDADQSDETGVRDQRRRVVALRQALERLDGSDAEALRSLADELVRRSVWIVGGDGWAYDIGFGGVDHVLASGRNVNLLVLDTEVYSNTGGQASKATPRGAVARFASAGKATAKKDLGMLAPMYGNVYVAQVSLGGNDVQTVKALLEADAWPGPSLVIAYASCVPAHGFPESQSMAHQRNAVRSGYWPLYRYRPASGEDGGEPSLRVDSRPPTIPLRDFAMSEERFAALARTNPERAEQLNALREADVVARHARLAHFQPNFER